MKEPISKFDFVETSQLLYEGRSESSNNCLVNHIIFIIKKKKYTYFNFNLSSIIVMKTKMMHHGILEICSW